MVTFSARVCTDGTAYMHQMDSTCAGVGHVAYTQVGVARNGGPGWPLICAYYLRTHWVRCLDWLHWWPILPACFLQTTTWHHFWILCMLVMMDILVLADSLSTLCIELAESHWNWYLARSLRMRQLKIRRKWFWSKAWHGQSTCDVVPSWYGAVCAHVLCRNTVLTVCMITKDYEV